MIKAIKKLNKMCRNGLGIWLAAAGFFVGALQLLIHSLNGEIPLWSLIIGEYMLFFSGVLFTVWGNPLRGKKVTVAPNDSVKDLLDRIVAGYAKGPYTVIELSYNSFEIRDAVCNKLGKEVLNKVYQDACNEIGVPFNGFELLNRNIDCAPQSNSAENVGIKNIQVNAK